MRPTAREAPPQRSAITAAWPFAIDLLLVVGFAAVGRATHESGMLGEGGVGLLTTAWPFVVALTAGWLLARAWGAPLAPVRAGVPVWAVTLVGGMLLRALSGQGTAVPFIVVATLTLLALLVGWRLLAALVRRSRS